MLNEIQTYLEVCRGKVNPNSNRNQRESSLWLARWEGFDDGVGPALNDCKHWLVAKYKEADKEAAAYGQPGDTGNLKMIKVAFAFGEIFRRYMRDTTRSTAESNEKSITIGALVVEGFDNNDVLTVDRKDWSYKGPAKRSPIVVHRGPTWQTVTGAEIQVVAKHEASKIVNSKPKDIERLLQASNRPIVKRRYDNAEFKKMLDTPFIRAMDIIQQTAYVVNPTILEVALKQTIGTKKDTNDATINSQQVDKAKGKYDELRKTKLDKTASDDDIAEHAFAEKAAKQLFLEKHSAWSKHKCKLQYNSKIDLDTSVTAQASQWADAEKFYSTCEADYRGRIYYTSPSFSYQGSDFAKALLLFEEKREMTQSGYAWLLRHTASQYNESISIDDIGVIGTRHWWLDKEYANILREKGQDTLSIDKVSIDDRMRWSTENMGLIHETAENRILHEGIEHPWMFLAACLEIVAYQTTISNGETYMSNFIVSVDGCANAYSHSAAINKDIKTAEMCGLVPSFMQNDIYIAVAKVMFTDNPERYTGITIPEARKYFAKTGVMVRAYTAGAGSIRDGIFRKMSGTTFLTRIGWDEEECYRVAKDCISGVNKVCPANEILKGFMVNLNEYILGEYDFYYDGENATAERQHIKRDIARKWDVVNELEKNGEDSEPVKAEIREMYDKLKEFTRVLRSGLGQSAVRWTTDSGFQAIQEFFFRDTIPIKFAYKGKSYSSKTGRMHMVMSFNTDAIDRKAHAKAITANIVHSNDSAHMCLTIDAMKPTSFAAVHDSFGVHASEVDCLLKHTKETFIKMYDHSNYYQHIKDIFLDDPDAFVQPLPEVGELNLEETLEHASFFFS